MVPCRSLDSVHATTLRCFASGKNTVHLLLLPCPSLLLVYYEQQLDPREIRETMRTQLGLPASFHLYLCPQAIFKFHPAFDDMLVSVFPLRKQPFHVLTTEPAPRCRKESVTWDNSSSEIRSRIRRSSSELTQSKMRTADTSTGLYVFCVRARSDCRFFPPFLAIR